MIFGYWGQLGVHVGLRVVDVGVDGHAIVQYSEIVLVVAVKILRWGIVTCSVSLSFIIKHKYLFAGSRTIVSFLISCCLWSSNSTWHRAAWTNILHKGGSGSFYLMLLVWLLLGWILTLEDRFFGLDSFVKQVRDLDIIETPARVLHHALTHEPTLLLFDELMSKYIRIQRSHLEAHVDLVGVALRVVKVKPLFPVPLPQVIREHTVVVARSPINITTFVICWILALIELAVFFRKLFLFLSCVDLWAIDFAFIIHSDPRAHPLQLPLLDGLPGLLNWELIVIISPALHNILLLLLVFHSVGSGLRRAGRINIVLQLPKLLISDPIPPKQPILHNNPELLKLLLLLHAIFLRVYLGLLEHAAAIALVVHEMLWVECLVLDFVGKRLFEGVGLVAVEQEIKKGLVVWGKHMQILRYF